MTTYLELRRTVERLNKERPKPSKPGDAKKGRELLKAWGERLSTEYVTMGAKLLLEALK